MYKPLHSPRKDFHSKALAEKYQALEELIDTNDTCTKCAEAELLQFTRSVLRKHGVLQRNYVPQPDHSYRKSTGSITSDCSAEFLDTRGNNSNQRHVTFTPSNTDLSINVDRNEKNTINKSSENVEMTTSIVKPRKSRQKRPATANDKKTGVGNVATSANLKVSSETEPNLTAEHDKPIRARSFSPTDCHLKNVANPEIRKWLRKKNRLLREKRHEKRKKKLQEVKEAKEKQIAATERVEQSEREVKIWFKQKGKEKSFMKATQQSDTDINFNRETAKSKDCTGCMSADSTFLSASLQGKKKSSGHESMPDLKECTCGYVAIQRQKEEEARRAQMAAKLRTLELERKRIRKLSSRQQKQQLIASKKTQNDQIHQKEPNTNEKQTSAKTAEEEMQHKRLSYDNWLKSKQKESKLKQKQARKEEERIANSIDNETKEVISSVARRRIDMILNKKKRVHLGPFDASNAQPTANGLLSGGETENTTNKDGMAADDNQPIPSNFKWKLDELDDQKLVKASSARPFSSKHSKQGNKNRPKSAVIERQQTDNPFQVGPKSSTGTPSVNAVSIQKPNLNTKAPAYKNVKYQQKSWDKFSDYVWDDVLHQVQREYEDTDPATISKPPHPPTTKKPMVRNPNRIQTIDKNQPKAQEHLFVVKETGNNSPQKEDIKIPNGFTDDEEDNGNCSDDTNQVSSLGKERKVDFQNNFDFWTGKEGNVKDANDVEEVEEVINEELSGVDEVDAIGLLENYNNLTGKTSKNNNAAGSRDDFDVIRTVAIANTNNPSSEAVANKHERDDNTRMIIGHHLPGSRVSISREDSVEKIPDAVTAEEVLEHKSSERRVEFNDEVQTIVYEELVEDTIDVLDMLVDSNATEATPSEVADLMADVIKNAYGHVHDFDGNSDDDF